MADQNGKRQGRIAAIYAELCLVWSQGEEIPCGLRGRFRGRIQPVVGDRVELEVKSDGTGTVTDLHPRENELSRNVADRKRMRKPSAPQVLAANVDLMVIVASLRKPPLRPGLFDRFLAAAAIASIAPMICISKLDLDPGGGYNAVRDTYAPLDIPVVGTDIHQPNTLAPLAAALRDKTAVLLGHSGVGKTSLLNALAGRDMAVKEVGFHKDRGRHTTSTSRLIPLDGGGFAIDSPGIREFGLHGIAAGELASLYPEFAPFLDECDFRDCFHRGEPGCAIAAAVAAGRISEARYTGYQKLLEELAGK